jgi:hypothetical protein
VPERTDSKEINKSTASINTHRIIHQFSIITSDLSSTIGSYRKCVARQETKRGHSKQFALFIVIRRQLKQHFLGESRNDHGKVLPTKESNFLIWDGSKRATHVTNLMGFSGNKKIFAINAVEDLSLKSFHTSDLSLELRMLAKSLELIASGSKATEESSFLVLKSQVKSHGFTTS